MSRTLTIHYKGGPLGGRTDRIDKSLFSGRRIRVPALMTFPNVVASSESAAHAPEHFTLVEEYELGRNLGTFGEYEARWIHPQEALIRENKKLKERLRDLERAEILLDSLRELKDLL